jgi:hypothetical protein
LVPLSRKARGWFTSHLPATATKIRDYGLAALVAAGDELALADGDRVGVGVGELDGVGVADGVTTVVGVADGVVDISVVVTGFGEFFFAGDVALFLCVE